MLHRMSQDVRYGVRTLLKAPGFAFVVVLTLALGIGATTTIFSVVHAVLIKPLPYPDANGLQSIWMTDPKATAGDMRGLGGRRGDPRVPVSLPTLGDLAARSSSFECLAGFSPTWPMTATGGGEAETVPAAWVTDGLFSMLGLAPEVGRDLSAEDHRTGAPRVALVGRALWDRRFGGARLDGQTITLDGVPFTVVGILPRSAMLPNTQSIVWLPFAYNPFATRRDVTIVYALGRLKPATTVQAADGELASVAASLSRDYPATYAGRGFTIVPLRSMIVGDVRTTVLVLFGAVGCLILIACANVANVMLARATSRHREIAVRAALGATRGQILQQLVVESLLLAVAGGAAGIALAWWGTSVVSAMFEMRLPVGTSLRLDVSVLIFATALSLVTGIVFGLAPALHAARVNLNDTLKESAQTGSGAGSRVRGALVVAEVALSLVLLCGAGLLVRSFWILAHVDPGFRTGHVVQAGVGLSPVRYPDAQRRRSYYAQAIEKIGALPGVTGVGAVNRLPLGSPANNVVYLEVEGQPAPLPGSATMVDRRVATPQYFQIMGIPLIGGRGFTRQDGSGAPLVAIVNRAMAKRFWPDGDPIGRRVRIGLQVQGQNASPWLAIVGVVGDVRHRGLDMDPNPEFYVPYEQASVQGMVLVARTDGDPRPLVEGVRTQLRALDREEPISGPTTLDEVLSQSVAQPRSRTLVFAAFAALALLLAAVGVYGVVSYAVSRMTRDIGVRVALGAGAADIVRMVVARGLRPVVAGLALGLVGALALSRMLTTLLFVVTPTDPLTYAAVASTLLAVAAIAAYVPARRAARVNPIVALRTE